MAGFFNVGTSILQRIGHNGQAIFNFFIFKKENTDAAEAVGLQVWNIQVGREDVVELFDKKLL